MTIRAQAVAQSMRNGGVMDYPVGNGGVTGAPATPRAPRLLDEVRRTLRVKHYSLRTEQAYVAWVRRFILANGKRHPRELGPAEVEAFLSGLATEGNVAAATQNQALSALLYLYREALGIELPWLDRAVRQLGGLQRTLIFTYEAATQTNLLATEFIPRA